MSEAKHYKREYKGVKLDPYRIAKVYDMRGGPREQIMKKCLRFTDKGQTEPEVVDELQQALDRWKEMLAEDKLPQPASPMPRPTSECPSGPRPYTGNR